MWRSDMTFAMGTCRSCAMKRVAEWNVFVPEPTDDTKAEMEAFWRSRFTQDEIDELWAAVSLCLDSSEVKAA